MVNQMLKIKKHNKIITKNKNNKINGYLLPINNQNEEFFDQDKLPQQFYITAVAPNEIKGPHLHYIRTGCFLCIKGDVRFVIKYKGKYEEIYSGENYGYNSVIVPTGISAAIQNICNYEAMIVNMPSPAWTPEMDDEHSDDFSDFDFSVYKRY